MKISIVIPVYNEAGHLGACLEAIGRQQLRPHEVIVVDNNSTDETVAIAERFSFVTLIREPRQGVVHARATGFDTATGDIIGRIDADSLLPPTWTRQVADIFKTSSIAAVSGAPHYHDFALSEVADVIDHYLRRRLAQRLGRTNFLWGANMGLRREAWLEVRSELCQQAALHEDFDLGIHLQSLGHSVAYDPTLIAGVSSRRIDSGFLAYVRYTLVSPRTYALHQLRSRFHMYPTLFVCWFFYLPGRMIYRAYDPASGAFSLSQLFMTAPPRVDPTVHVA